MPPHPLYNSEMQNFNFEILHFSLHKMQDVVYVINFDEYKSIEIHWTALYVNGDKVIYFDSFEVEFFPKEIKSS